VSSINSNSLLTVIIVDPQGVRQIKLAGADVKDKGKAKAVLEDIGEAEPSAGPAQSERDGADEIAAEAAEEQRREDDLARLNILGVDRRREIARQDIMGEFGSKVGSQECHRLIR
jgi:hypothetical protein